jgi:tRNA (guanine37-N1)-methyltransferase
MAEEFSREDDLVFLCGHYEGIDQRVIDEVVTDEVSIGDFVMTGGELPALVMMDAISRMVPGVLSNEESAGTESFMGDGLLEYPQYSRPELWRGHQVPEILLSGNHGAVDRWRREQSLMITASKRPDLCTGAVLDKKDRKFLREAGLTEAFRGAREI